MTPRPRYLGPAGRKAWDRAVEHIEERRGDLATLYDVALAFARAADRSAAAYEAWRAAGEPLLVEYPNGTSGPHSALKAVEGAERALLRCARALGLVVPGPARRPTRAVPPQPEAEGAADRLRLVQDVRKEEGRG